MQKIARAVREVDAGEQGRRSRRRDWILKSIGSTVTIGRVDEDAAAGGKYFGDTISVANNTPIDDTTDADAAEFSTGGTPCMFINLEEEGESTHILTEGAMTPLWIGVRVGTFEDMPVYAGFSLKSTSCTE